jgi:hypothetical protein
MALGGISTLSPAQGEEVSEVHEPDVFLAKEMGPFSGLNTNGHKNSAQFLHWWSLSIGTLLP